MRRSLAWTLSTATLVATVAVAVHGGGAPRGDLVAGETYRLDAGAFGAHDGGLTERWWGCRFDTGRVDLPDNHACARLWGGLLGPTVFNGEVRDGARGRDTRIVSALPAPGPPTNPDPALSRRQRPAAGTGVLPAPDPGPAVPAPPPVVVDPFVPPAATDRRGPVAPCTNRRCNAPARPRQKCLDGQTWDRWVEDPNADSWLWDPVCAGPRNTERDEARGWPFGAVPLDDLVRTV